MASTTLYCICRQPYNENSFMIECDICKDWFHGSCVEIKEYQASDIDTYHCPRCQPEHGPLILKNRRNWHRHDYTENDENYSKAVQTGTVTFIRELKNRTFPSGDQIPVVRLNGWEVDQYYIETDGFTTPILVEKKDGLGLNVPPSNFSIRDVENCVGSMRELDVIDVACQEDCKMLMREWTDYYESPNRKKIYNVISLEFTGTKLCDLVNPPKLVQDISWVHNYWPSDSVLPEDVYYQRPEVSRYCLMGVKDSFTDFHIDFGGTSVWYHVLRGEKVFYLIRPTPYNLQLYEEWLSSSNQSEMFFGDQVDVCYKTVVKQGHTLFIPTGWIHAVLTPIDSLVFGGNFLHSYGIELQIRVYELEKRVATPNKFQFPNFELLHWYAAKQLLDTIKDYTEEGKQPPDYLAAGAKALEIALTSWTKKKELTSLSIFTRKGSVPETIQYGKLLKDLSKETAEFKFSTSHQSLMEFAPLIPKLRKSRNHKLKKSDRAKKKAKKKEPLEKTDLDLNYDIKDDKLRLQIPGKSGDHNPLIHFDEKLSSNTSLKNQTTRGIKLKVSNGRTLSSPLSSPTSQASFHPFSSDARSDTESGSSDNSDSDQLVVDETGGRHGNKHGSSAPRSPRARQGKRRGSRSPVKPGSLKLKLSVGSTLNSGDKTRMSASSLSSSFPTFGGSPAESGIAGILRASQCYETDVKVDVEGDDVALDGRTSPSMRDAIQGMLSMSRGGAPLKPVAMETDQHHTLAPTSQSYSNTFNYSLSATSQPQPVRETTRPLEQHQQRVSRDVTSGNSVKSEKSRDNLDGCYKDDTYVYTSLAPSDDEDAHIFKPRGRIGRDDNWNPKAKIAKGPVDGSKANTARPHREGARREAVESGLAAAAAKLSGQPEPKLSYQRRKPKTERRKSLLDPDQGPSGFNLSSSASGFLSSDDGISLTKLPAPSQPTQFKAKKHKKGEATAKQRLGKKLKLLKMCK